jgi:stress-induced morphogen
MPISRDELATLIEQAFPESTIEYTDLAGDNDHWQVSICSKAFIGKSRIEQHKMVQQATASHNIHALAIKTSIPAN